MRQLTSASQLSCLRPNLADRNCDLMQFFSDVADIQPDQMTTDKLKELVKRIDWKDRLTLSFIKKQGCFKPDRLGLKTILRHEYMSLSAVCLLPEQKSIVHRHNQALEVSVLLEGKLTHKIFKLSEEQELVLDCQEEVVAGAILCTPRYTYHQILNTSKDKVLLVAFHSPALELH